MPVLVIKCTASRRATLINMIEILQRPVQFKPRTGAHGSTRTEGVNFCRRNHAPAWLVLTWKATRSPSTLMGSSRSFVEGELSGSGCCDSGALVESVKLVNDKFPAPSTNMVR